MWILIRWLCQKPADLDLHFFQKEINPDSQDDLDLQCFQKRINPDSSVDLDLQCFQKKKS